MGYKTVKGISKEDIRIAYGHRQQCIEGRREERAGSGWREGKGRKLGNTCNHVNNKDKIYFLN